MARPAARALLTAFAVLTLGAPPVLALTTFTEGVDSYMEITFQSAPLGSTASVLLLGLGGSLSPGSLTGCTFQLYAGGGLISSSTISSALGCQGGWFAGSATSSPVVDTNVDLSGLSAGQAGRIVMTPLFGTPHPGVFNPSTPVLYLGSSPVPILSQQTVQVPEPSCGVLLLAALHLVRRRLRGRR